MVRNATGADRVTVTVAKFDEEHQLGVSGHFEDATNLDVLTTIVADLGCAICAALGNGTKIDITMPDGSKLETLSPGTEVTAKHIEQDPSTFPRPA
jgi:hypothetical protein